MQLLRDIDFEFAGFSGTEGRCHIRLARASEQAPLVIVCSQYQNYYGTSVTNGFELIFTKLFRDIAELRVDGVRFDDSLPIVKDSRNAHLVFERLLNRILPKRYRTPTAVRLDFVQMFSSLIWIEHYPEGTGIHPSAATVSVVTLDSNGSPVWRHGLSNEEVQASGLNRKQLFVEGAEVDLEQRKASLGMESDAAADSPQAQDMPIPGFRQVRWITDLLDNLPKKIELKRFEIGDDKNAPFDEKYIHLLMLEILALSLPASDLVGRDYSIGKKLGLYLRGREKECDLVIFWPEEHHPYAVLEVKRTLAKSGTLLREVMQDLARLVLCSHAFGSYAYQVVVGDLAQIRDELEGLLPCTFDMNAEPLAVPVASLVLDGEYRKALKQAGISVVYVKTQGVADEKASSVLLWEVSHDPLRMDIQRPYTFQLLRVV